MVYSSRLAYIIRRPGWWSAIDTPIFFMNSINLRYNIVSFSMSCEKSLKGHLFHQGLHKNLRGSTGGKSSIVFLMYARKYIWWGLRHTAVSKNKWTISERNWEASTGVRGVSKGVPCEQNTYHVVVLCMKFHSFPILSSQLLPCLWCSGEKSRDVLNLIPEWLNSFSHFNFFKLNLILIVRL